MPISALPPNVSIDEIEQHLDRVALEISESEYGQEYIPLFQWLEEQLEERRKQRTTMDAVRARVARSKPVLDARE
ncbi:hypothetical protein OIU34_26715 [Pararhizobium sp. BT-229]|uniref:hypothetical protein n=1 Tax=Pararhizobium sp. BT-229 TaxID=2986923 RepID=UPI0021F6B0CF|nr:hypothetical protein [Pararhizobium sp. BT-229]MCV9965476.1 hypothetical protein [Pararhizobium sp. BT-229]